MAPGRCLVPGYPWLSVGLVKNCYGSDILGRYRDSLSERAGVAAGSRGGAGWSARVGTPPRASDAAAATRQAAIANVNAACRPSRNGPEIRSGKNEWPTRAALSCGD